ncbi:hypothetical protein FHX39_001334 [Friedmanniella antarctica]|uniref:Uncharacterized protein n=1 Tax=Microlunatus antarcticus TaxID=53388 RepID=A0A7W5P6D0_9ACTN|nr:hypothetical protein [Microlunatus antarcticus]MBB3326390.1 hypothetical protein [Microlunatus antarcticus]
MRDDESLADLYRAAITEVPGTGALDPARARATARRRRQGSSAVLAGMGAVVLVGLLLLLPQITNSTYLTAAPAAPTHSAEPVMTVVPTTAPAGTSVTVYFPTGLTRGLGFTLGATSPDTAGPGKPPRPTDEERVDYYLTAGRNGAEPDPRSWNPAYPTVDVAWPSVVVKGTGGDKVHIPEPTAAGEYRLCTAAVAPGSCTTITIT